MSRLVPDEARAVLSNMRYSMSEGSYLDSIWSARDHQQNAGKSIGKWPFIRASDRPPEALVDVTRLPVKLRGRE